MKSFIPKTLLNVLKSRKSTSFRVFTSL